jgi:hypothetical protein
VENDEQLLNLRERAAEAKARLEQLEGRPSAIKYELFDAEQEGDVGAADALENELAGLTSVIEAARYRSTVLDEVLKSAEWDRKQAEQAAASAEGLREHYARLSRPLFNERDLVGINRHLENEAKRLGSGVFDPRAETTM